MNEFQRFLSIWMIIDRIISSVVNAGGQPNPFAVATTAQNTLESKVSTGHLHPSILDGSDKVIQDAIAIHPDIQTGPPVRIEPVRQQNQQK